MRHMLDQIAEVLPFACQVSEEYVRLRQFPPRIQKGNAVRYHIDVGAWSEKCLAELEQAGKITLTHGRATFTVWNTTHHLEKLRDKIAGPQGAQIYHRAWHTRAGVFSGFAARLRACVMRWLDTTIMRGPYLTLCTSPAEFTEVMRHLGVKNPAEWLGDNQHGAVHHFYNSGAVSCVVCVRMDDGRDGVAVAGTLLHEAVHVFQEYCDSIGEHAPSREFEAYSIQAIALELMNEYKRRIGS